MFAHRSASKLKVNVSSTTKTHLIRGAFYLFLLLSAFVIPLALGQRYVTDSSAGENTLRLPKCGTLYSQYDNVATEPPLGIGSQQFESAMAAFNDQAADDFVLPTAPERYLILAVHVVGEYSQGGGPAASFNVFFY